MNQQTLISENKLKKLNNKKQKKINSAEEFQINYQELEKQMLKLRFENADSK